MNKKAIKTRNIILKCLNLGCKAFASNKKEKKGGKTRKNTALTAVSVAKTVEFDRAAQKTNNLDRQSLLKRLLQSNCG